MFNERVSRSPFAGRYRFCTQCGHPKPTARSEVEYQCEACGFKHFINPIAAVVAILSSRTGDLLLIRRARDPGQGKLGLPGGFVDPGETAEEALRREVREETTLELNDFAYFTALPNVYVYQGIPTPTLDLFFTGKVESFAHARAMPEVESLVVVSPKDVDLAEMAFASNTRALRLFLNRGSMLQDH